MRRFLASMLAFLLAGDASANPLALILANQDAAPIVADPAASNVHEASGEPGTEGSLVAADLSDLSRRLTAIALSYEAIRDASALDPEVKRLVDYTAPQGLIPDPSDRTQTLDRVYRALAVIDGTHALRYPEGEDCARAHRLAMLRSSDGLFADPKTGELSPWLKAELNRSKANDAPAGLIAASAREWNALGYLQTLVEVRSLSLRLADGKVLGAPRVAAFCRRAKLYAELASAQGAFDWNDPDLTAQAKSIVEVRWGDEKGTGTVLLWAGQTIVLVSGRFTENAYEAPEVFAQSGRRLAASNVRRGSALSILSIQPSPDVVPLALSENPEGADFVAYALGHPVQGGPWSVTRGLARGDGSLLRADAAIDAAQAGGPLFDARGLLTGIIADDNAAYRLSTIARWLKDENARLPSILVRPELGTGALLTASSAIPRGQPALIESAMVCKDVRGCTLPSEPSGGGSGYSYSAPYSGPNLWSILGKVFRPAPKVVPQVVEYRQHEQALPIVEAPKPPPEPPKPECSFAEVNPPKTVGTDPIEIRVQFTCKYPDGAKPVDLSKQKVTFTVGWKGEKVLTRTVLTDAQGMARVSIAVQSTEGASEKAHDALDNYERSLKPPVAPPAAPAPFIGVSRGVGLINTANPGSPSPDSVGISSSTRDASQAFAAAAIVLVRTQATRTAVITVGATISLGPVASTVVLVGALAVSIDVVWRIAKFAMSVDKEMNDSLDRYNEAIDTNPAPPRTVKKREFDELARYNPEADSDGDDPCDAVLDKGQLKNAGINKLEHEVKADALQTKKNLSKFDLCGCKDGRVVVKFHGCRGPIIAITEHKWR